MRLLLVTIFACFLLAGCADNRPDLQEAKRSFQQRYPGVHIISAVISEDEVIAGSFKFRYRKQGSLAEREIEIQFMENPKTKQWEPSPEPPKKLP